MGMIRGILRPEREIRPKVITVGEPIWNPIFEENGKTYGIEVKTGNKVELITITLEEFLRGINEPPTSQL